MNNTKDTTEYQYFQFKVPKPLWKKLRLKALNDDKTANETLIDIVKHHVQR